MLGRFTEWFSSAAGVWQTAVFCLTWVILERVFPGVDPNGFALLYVMTVYSAATQPALAYANRQDTAQMDALLEKIEKLEKKILEKLETK